MKLFRSAVASLVVGGVVVLGGCAADAGDDSSGAGASSTPAAVEVQEDLATVDLRIARSLLDPDESLTDEEIVSAAREQNIVAVVEGDTVIYTMTKPQRDEMLAELHTAAQEAVDGIIADDTNSVTGVEYDDDMTSFQVSVDGDRFAPIESFLVLAFYIQGALYQQFAGIPQDDIDITVDFVDDATGEVLESGSYQEMRANLEQ